MTTYSSGWYPTTSSSSPSINIFIPCSSSYSRETHEMYNELGFILRPSKTIPNSRTTTKSKSSLGSSFKLTKSRSYVNEMVGRLLRHSQLSWPSVRRVALPPIDKPRVAIVWPYSPSSQSTLLRPACVTAREPIHTLSTSLESHTQHRASQKNRIYYQNATKKLARLSFPIINSVPHDLVFTVVAIGHSNGHPLYHI